MTLNELRNGTAQIILLAKRFINGISSIGNPYTKILVRDISGNDASLFDWNGACFSIPNTPVLIEANVTGEEKNNSVIYKVNNYIVCNDQNNIFSYFPPPRIDQNAYVSEFCTMVNSLPTELSRLVKEISQMESDNFKRLPLTESGAYAVTSGILEATVNLARLSQSCSIMFPSVDRSLLLAGALVYYIGFTKTIGWSYSNTKEEILSGGGMNAAFMIRDAAASLLRKNIFISAETISLLCHIVTSRTGERPTAIKEAVILRDLDHMLQKVDEIVKAEKICSPGEMCKVKKGIYYNINRNNN